MKKLLLFFLLASPSVLLSQTILNTYPLDLKTTDVNNQILNAEDAKTHDVYVFAVDSKNINILKYNKNFFLTTQFTDSINDASNRWLIGSSISDDGNPSLYWSTGKSNTILITKYYLENKTSKTLNFTFPENIESVITTFQNNNTFYILGKEKSNQHLLLYEFKNGKCEIKMFDFSTFLFQNERGLKFSLSSLLRYFPIQKIESDDFNPLSKTSSINKMYVLDNRIILTFDYNLKKTQVFDLDMETSEVTEKNFDQPVSKTPTRTSNSFYNENKLFQIKASKDEFLLNIKDFDSGKTIKNIALSKNDTIRFKNSPLYLQINDNKPQELKTTGKFLKQLSNLSAGISVLKSKNTNLITFGGYIEYIVSDFNYGLNNAYDDFGRQGQYSQSKMVYFDSVLNSDLEFITGEKSEPLAIDNIFYFLSLNKDVSFQNILKLKDYSVLTYYDTVLKQYTIRKFTDGFMREDSGNPISNKAVFSKSFPLKRP
ncbi:hypothetical protein [Flavobacterium chilense]|uniref:6-bladed beta-propeller protein n=1 Tax=Flavobacterium chilense TaxID=946677 RepID=A0A1M7D6E4_9FLAO|nr:hypothetical protein [Flavobacterium chilense]SHL74739.1 hypothetical protein SAMN05444484_102437 [Flavobacterium chilense]